MQCAECAWTHDHVHADTRPEVLPWEETSEGDPHEDLGIEDLLFELRDDR